ncbi:hypothetical protein SCANM63S_09583 [Streptomyces canarius]
MPGHVRGFGVPAHDQLALGDHLRHVRADEVDAEHLPAAGLRHDLHHAALAVHHPLGDGGQRHRVDVDLLPTRAVASASLSPTEAVCGEEYVTRGTAA